MLLFTLGGVAFRLHTDDREIAKRAGRGLARWRPRGRSPAEATREPPVELHVHRVPRFPGGRWVKSTARWEEPEALTSGGYDPSASTPSASEGLPPHEIAARWFRLRTDAAARRMDADVDSTHGLGDFYRLALGTALLLRDGFLLHAAAIEMPSGAVYLFCGPSGFGKTTLARLAPRRAVLADDTVAVRIKGRALLARRSAKREGGCPPGKPESGSPGRPQGSPLQAGRVLVYPTPFFGEYGRPPETLHPRARPVTRIYLLAPHPGVNRLGARKSRALVDLYAGPSAPSAWTRNGGHRIEPVSPGVAAAALLAQVIAPDAAPEDVQRRLLDRVVAVAAAVPAFRLAYTPDASVWEFLRRHAPA